MENGFEPIFTKDSKILILGSFPSVKSRKAGFYYGNPQNRFWKMLSSIFATKPLITIEEKIAFLNRHKIAIYDIFTKSDIKGSADSNLAKANNCAANLSLLLPPHTKIEKILCNGKLAFDACTKLNLNLPIIKMPSTSPANPRYNKQEWENELEFLK